MTHIKLVKDFGSAEERENGADKAVKELYNGAFRRLVEVRLQNNAVLARHHADVPITVYCISGNGIFSAGPDLEDSQDLRGGTLITLEAGVEHEVIADPELHILVSKFKAS